MENGKVVLQNPAPGEYTIVHREGQAPTIKILNPATIQQAAIITAPLDFYTVRKEMVVGGKAYFGIPADEARGKYRELAALRQLPDLVKKLR